MAETFTRFDAADYLKTPEDIAAYLEAAAEDGDSAAMAAALGAVARAQNMSKLARDAGLSREGLYKALKPGGNPAFTTVAKVARALGYEVAFRPMHPAASANNKVLTSSPAKAPLNRLRLRAPPRDTAAVAMTAAKPKTRTRFKAPGD